MKKHPVSLTVLLSIKIGIFLSLYKGKKTQKDFLIKNETEIFIFKIFFEIFVVKIYSMVALRIYVLVCPSTEQFPDKSVFIKTVSVTSSNLQSMFFIVLKRAFLLSHGESLTGIFKK